MEESLRKHLQKKHGDLMKTLIGEYRSDKYVRRASIFITPAMGYEIIFYENDIEVDRKTCIGKYDHAEDVAMNWVSNNKV